MPAELRNLNKLASELLETGEVELVIGYAAADPLAAAPVFVRDPGEAERLIFDRTCENNLTNYLHRCTEKRVAIVVKGCDERSLMGLIQEKQLDREQIIVIGAPCKGVIDPKLVLKAVGGDAIKAARIEGDSVNVTDARGKKISLPVEAIVYAGCRECPVRNPRFADYIIGESVAQPDVPEFSPRMQETAALSREERWTIFEREMSKCILCCACRDLCPACYCTECFVDSSQPKWVGKTDDPADAMLFHLTRFMHLAGRCTGCGACVRGCPVNVDLGIYNDVLRKEVKEAFDFEAGIDSEAEPPLGCFQQDDSDDFTFSPGK